MNALHTVVETPAFMAKASKTMSDNERASIVDMIAANPRMGVLIQGTGGLRKARFGIGDRRRRGGGRGDLLVSIRRLPGGSALGVREE